MVYLQLYSHLKCGYYLLLCCYLLTYKKAYSFNTRIFSLNNLFSVNAVSYLLVGQNSQQNLSYLPNSYVPWNATLYASAVEQEVLQDSSSSLAEWFLDSKIIKLFFFPSAVQN